MRFFPLAFPTVPAYPWYGYGYTRNIHVSLMTFRPVSRVTMVRLDLIDIIHWAPELHYAGCNIMSTSRRNGWPQNYGRHWMWVRGRLILSSTDAQDFEDYSIASNQSMVSRYHPMCCRFGGVALEGCCNHCNQQVSGTVWLKHYSLNYLPLFPGSNFSVPRPPHHRLSALRLLLD